MSDCNDVTEKMRRRNLKVAAANAMGGVAAFYSGSL